MMLMMLMLMLPVLEVSAAPGARRAGRSEEQSSLVATSCAGRRAGMARQAGAVCSLWLLLAQSPSRAQSTLKRRNLLYARTRLDDSIPPLNVTGRAGSIEKGQQKDDGWVERDGGPGQVVTGRGGPAGSEDCPCAEATHRGMEREGGVGRAGQGRRYLPAKACIGEEQAGRRGEETQSLYSTMVCTPKAAEPVAQAANVGQTAWGREGSLKMGNIEAIECKARTIVSCPRTTLLRVALCGSVEAVGRMDGHEGDL
ncbi:hypothetical protein DFH27DRAFT_656248 [Peziza echinospora]|nr:hypothetical protein DFH27DRAFT_656248 [Peziza echinospora]